MPAPEPIKEEAFLAYVGQKQPSSLHLAEFIYHHLEPMRQLRGERLRQALAEETNPTRASKLRESLTELTDMVPDMLRDDWLGPEANPEIVFPYKPHKDLPAILQQSPEFLLENIYPLASLSDCAQSCRVDGTGRAGTAVAGPWAHYPPRAF